MLITCNGTLYESNFKWQDIQTWINSLQKMESKTL